MNNDIKTLAQFNDFFKDEKSCYAFLELQRWNNKPVCPHCGSAKKPYNVKPRGLFKEIPSYRCSDMDCDLPFTVRTASIFEGSKVELRKWFQASYEIATATKGISSVELATRIGVSQKTAWFMNHRLRAVVAENKPNQLKGNIEIDETFIGGKSKNKHKKDRNNSTGYINKTSVFGMLERNGNIHTQVVDNVEGITLKPIISRIAEPGSTLITDGFGGYKDVDKIKDMNYKHEIINHTQDEYVRGDFHTNTIENFWSLLKRGIIGTFHSLSAKHLHRYCDEFAYRYNNKGQSNIFRFSDSMNRFDKARLTYADLVG